LSHCLLRHSAEKSESLRVPTIYCVGLNYLEHAQEMQSPRPLEPVIFLKPASALVADGGVVRYPAFSQEMHHEIELVVAIAKDCSQLSVAEAKEVILGYGIGLDLTLRDLQARAKAAGKPWSVAKGFATSAPLSVLIPVEQIEKPQELQFQLTVNGEIRQQGAVKEMLFSIPELIAYLSGVFDLQRGDLIYTGTPAGVGPVYPDDVLSAELMGLSQVTVKVE
jgi:acylpyruvate hydrolase